MALSRQTPTHFIDPCSVYDYLYAHSSNPHFIAAPCSAEVTSSGLFALKFTGLLSSESQKFLINLNDPPITLWMNPDDPSERRSRAKFTLHRFVKERLSQEPLRQFIYMVKNARSTHFGKCVYIRESVKVVVLDHLPYQWEEVRGVTQIDISFINLTNNRVAADMVLNPFLSLSHVHLTILRRINLPDSVQLRWRLPGVLEIPGIPSHVGGELLRKFFPDNRPALDLGADDQTEDAADATDDDVSEHLDLAGGGGGNGNEDGAQESGRDGRSRSPRARVPISEPAVSVSMTNCTHCMVILSRAD